MTFLPRFARGGIILESKTKIAIHAECLRLYPALLSWAEDNAFLIINDLSDPACTQLPVLLLDESRRLSLFRKENKQKMWVNVDFDGGYHCYRRQQATFKNELLARAVGLKSSQANTLKIVDATAGFGRDSFLLASLGCEVMMLERSMLMVLLLTDGLRRASESSALVAIMARLQLQHINASDYIQHLSFNDQAKTAMGAFVPDVIYLDPMFPSSKNNAQVKKDMRILREVIGEDVDGDLLVQAALVSGVKRVVIKRPRKGEALGQRKPDHQVMGQSSRFDVYFPKR